MDQKTQFFENFDDQPLAKVKKWHFLAFSAISAKTGQNLSEPRRKTLFASLENDQDLASDLGLGQNPRFVKKGQKSPKSKKRGFRRGSQEAIFGQNLDFRGRRGGPEEGYPQNLTKSARTRGVWEAIFRVFRGRSFSLLVSWSGRVEIFTCETFAVGGR